MIEHAGEVTPMIGMIGQHPNQFHNEKPDFRHVIPSTAFSARTKTYPTLSASYGELVCTAGLREDRTWIRIYPVPFRSLEEYQKVSPHYDNKQICRVQVSRSGRPVFTNHEGKDEFFVRTGCSSQPLGRSEQSTYEREHWA